MNFNYADYFERRKEVCGGELVVKGTRVTVRTLLASFAEGATMEQVQADFSTVSTDALRAVIAFASAAAADDLPVPSEQWLQRARGAAMPETTTAAILAETRG